MVALLQSVWVGEDTW